MRHAINADTLDTSWNANMVVEVATETDLEALVNLEEQCFSAPWSRKSFEAELSGNQFSRILSIPSPDPSSDIPLLAYICVWLIFEEIRFLNLAVHPQYRGQGLAKRLIGEALYLGIEQKCCRGMLEVRHSNLAARTLYESFNFKEYATRNSYYTNPTEDAILMMLEPLSKPFSEQRDSPRNLEK